MSRAVLILICTYKLPYYPGYFFQHFHFIWEALNKLEDSLFVHLTSFEYLSCSYQNVMLLFSLCLWTCQTLLCSGFMNSWFRKWKMNFSVCVYLECPKVCSQKWVVSAEEGFVGHIKSAWWLPSCFVSGQASKTRIVFGVFWMNVSLHAQVL